MIADNPFTQALILHAMKTVKNRTSGKRFKPPIFGLNKMDKGIANFWRKRGRNYSTRTNFLRQFHASTNPAKETGILHAKS
jgi:hypothetical protein